MTPIARLCAGLACAVSMAGAGGSALAAAAITFIGGEAIDVVPDETAGFNFFTGAQGYTITARGYCDAGGDGLAQSHEVGIWSADGLTLLAHAVVPGGTAGALDSGFRFVDIAPVYLPGGAEYLAGGYTGSNADTIIRLTQATGVGVTIGSTRFDLISNGVLNAPLGSQGDILDDGYFGPNFGGFAGRGAVPEPTTWALMILGFGGVGAAVRRKHRRAAHAS
jgi:hypothetical protein